MAAEIMPRDMNEKTRKVLYALRFPVLFIVLIWVIHTIKFFSGESFGQLGVYPREFSGLIGVMFSPVIHGDWQHLISNTVVLGPLMGVLYLFYKRVAMKSFFSIYLLTGLSVWLFARPVFHIGASGVVYGLISFLFWTGVFRRNARSIVLSLIILLMYSGYVVGVVPGKPGISWESHLLGAIVGIVVAYIFKDYLEMDEQREPLSEESPPERYFLQRDIFEHTHAERRARQSQNYWESNNTGL